jgi:hypothetical protein
MPTLSLSLSLIGSGAFPSLPRTMTRFMPAAQLSTRKAYAHPTTLCGLRTTSSTNLYGQCDKKIIELACHSILDFRKMRGVASSLNDALHRAFSFVESENACSIHCNAVVPEDSFVGLLLLARCIRKVYLLLCVTSTCGVHSIFY